MSKQHPSHFEAIKTAARQHMGELKVPGVAIGIIHEGKVEMGGLGITNVNDPQPVTEDTIFYIGSVTKPFTATVVLKMAERGELELEAPLRQYLPGFQVQDLEATLEARVIDLFQHRTGWRGDYFDDPSSGEDALEKAVLAFRFLPQRTPYGEVWAYNNNNYIIAGRLIQVLSRARSYEQRVREELLDPLGMARTSFFMPELMAERFACGHAAVFDGDSDPQVRFQPLVRAVWPAGGLLSCASDLLKWVRFQLDGKDKEGQQLLSRELLSQAHSPLVRGPVHRHMGIAWFVEQAGGLWTASHDGHVSGFTATTFLVPAQGFGMVVLANSDRGTEVIDGAIAHALRLYFGVEKEPVTAVEAPLAALEPFVGTWVGDLEDYRIYFEGEQLTAQRVAKPLALGLPVLGENPPPMPLASAGPDRCVVTGGPYAGMAGEILRDGNGQPQFLCMGVRIYSREK